VKTTVMSRAQQKIIGEAPRFLFFHCPGRNRGLIPDTTKARKWAIEKRGATELNGTTFHYFGLDRRGSDYRVGDFYCVISHKETEYFELRPGIRPYKIDTDVALRAQKFLSEIFNVVNLNCRCLYLGPLTIGVSIPSSAFEMEGGAIFLEDLYRETVARMSQFGTEFGLEVSYCLTVPVENTRLTSGLFAIPFLFDEVSRLGMPLEELASSPRVVPNVNFGGKINPAILADMKRNAAALADMKREAADEWRRRRKKALWQEQPEREYLVNFERADLCSSINAKAAQKCALKLEKWIARNKLTEFGLRDAVRAARQRLRGPFGDGGGVADALQILISAHYVRECPFPSMEYLCKRPSPWFLVNPLL
jgi:hypothetical protein